MTHLLIPEQSGTTDSCDIVNEESLVGFQDKHNLVTLGWIHVMLLEIFVIQLIVGHKNTAEHTKNNI